jgi:hypothetical protein
LTPAAIRRALQLHRAPSFHRGNWGGVDYFFGAEAYEEWARALEQLDYPADTEGPFETNGREEAHDWYNMGNMDMQVDQIVTGRSAAGSYCRTQADRIGGRPAVALRQAAEAYAAQVDLARQQFAAFIPPFDGRDEHRRRWLADRRKCRAGAQTLRRMAQHEHQAIEALGRILEQKNR